jgi:hypothetical protein
MEQNQEDFGHNVDDFARNIIKAAVFYSSPPAERDHSPPS